MAENLIAFVAWGAAALLALALASTSVAAPPGFAFVSLADEFLTGQ